MKTALRAGLTHGEWIRVKNGELEIHDVMDRLLHGEIVFEGNQTHGLMAMLNYLCGDAGLEFGFSRLDIELLKWGGKSDDFEHLAARIDSFLPPEPS